MHASPRPVASRFPTATERYENPITPYRFIRRGTMKRARLACALSLAALACSASGARAGDWWLAPPHPGTQRVGDWYLGASGFGGVLVFPTLNGQTVFTFPASEPLGVVSTRHKITAAGGGLTFGHVLRDG